MSEKNKIPEVDIVVDEAAGVIREVKTDNFRSKKGHERRVNTSIYIVLILMSIIPVIIFYLCCQKHIIKGVAAGAVKG